MRFSCLPAALLGLWFVLPAAAQTAVSPPASAPQHEANFDAERKQANELYLADKVLEALPLYEDLCRQDQTIAVFAERHAMGLAKKQATMPDGAARQAVYQQSMAELKRAQALGDNSPLVQNLLSMQGKSVVGAIVSGVPLTVGYTYRGKPEAQASLKEAEAAFAKNDMDTALKAYQRAAALDAAWYEAPLYEGDAYFRMKDWTKAGVCFQKAIEIDPDRDTAYRYWGDALFKSGDSASARGKYELGVVAEPYSKPGWSSLQQWANLTKTPLRVPRIVRPEGKVADGKLQVDPGMATETGDGHASWVVYERARLAHGGLMLNQFIVAGSSDKNGQLTPSGYRHSLAEETDSLNAMLVDVQAKLAEGTVTEEKLEPSIKMLRQLQKDGMLECWIVLNGADAGIRYDYPAYRKGHRELLVAYLDRYVVGQGAAQP